MPSQRKRVIFGPQGTETHEPIHLTFGMFDCVHSPTSQAKFGGCQKWGWIGHRVKLYPLVLFLFSVPSSRPQLTLRSVDFRSMQTKMCFRDWCVPLGSVCPEVKSFPFTPKPFSMVQIRLLFCMGVNRK